MLSYVQWRCRCVDTLLVVLHFRLVFQGCAAGSGEGDAGDGG